MITRKTSGMILEKALSLGADFAEIYAEDGETLNISFNRSVTDLYSTHTYGVGLYLIKGLRSVYTYSNDMSETSLAALCVRAASLLGAKRAARVDIPILSQIAVAEPNPVRVYPGTVRHFKKVDQLAKTNKAVRSLGSDVVNAEAGYFDSDRRITVANSEGVWAEDRRVMSRIRLTPTVSNGKESIGYFVQSSRSMGFEMFMGEAFEDLVVDTVNEMRVTLGADEAPNGLFPVVIAAGSPSGMFFHKCCGHQLETNNDLLSGGIFSGKLGEKIASGKVTLVDDGTLPGMHGSSKYDDEGMPRQKNVLIENGVLKSYLVDRMGSLKLSVPRNGSGRRQNYSFAPAARMSNTYAAAGDDDLGEMIKTVHEGLYVTRMGGGHGGPDFTMLANTAYWIKNGVIDHPVKNAILMGRGDETLLKVDRVGKELYLEKSGTNCGGASGVCEVSTSGAAVRVSEMLIGGKG